MRQRANTYDLAIGDMYVHSNPYHHECEYGFIWYVGTSQDKYGDVIYCFSDTEMELPAEYDGDASLLNFGGPVFPESDIENGAVALP